MSAYKANSSPGWVYIIRCGEYYKIGRTVNVRQRISDLQTASPYLLELFGAVYCDDSMWLEQVKHREWMNRQAIREWFNLDRVMAERIADELRHACCYNDPLWQCRWLDSNYQECVWTMDFPPWVEERSRPHRYSAKRDTERLWSHRIFISSPTLCPVMWKDSAVDYNDYSDSDIKVFRIAEQERPHTPSTKRISPDPPDARHSGRV